MNRLDLNQKGLGQWLIKVLKRYNNGSQKKYIPQELSKRSILVEAPFMLFFGVGVRDFYEISPIN